MTKYICVINWKGGCGKTTIATHLAVALAESGLKTGLADCDRQKTAKLWDTLRPKDAVTVSLVDWRKNFGRCPAISPAHDCRLPAVTQDQTGACHHRRKQPRRGSAATIDLRRDGHAALPKRLEAIKSVRKRKKRVLLVANRYRTGRSASRRLEEFLVTEGLLLTARIPEREIYSDLARDGLTVFDRTSKTAIEQQQAWLPLVRAVEMSWHK